MFEFSQFSRIIKSTFTFPRVTRSKDIFGNNGLRTVKVEASRFETRLSRLLHDLFLPSYNSLKYPQLRVQCIHICVEFLNCVQRSAAVFTRSIEINECYLAFLNLSQAEDKKQTNKIATLLLKLNICPRVCLQLSQCTIVDRIITRHIFETYCFRSVSNFHLVKLINTTFHSDS